MKKAIINILAILVLASCNSANLTESEELNARISRACENSVWLNSKIESLQTLNTTARLTQYTYNGQTVFEVETCLHCADRMITVYSCEGVVICQFGGVAGFNTCPDFYETATNKKVIWHN